MECKWDAALLKGGDELPAELLDCIRRQAEHREYLEALTRTILDARYSYTILAHCENILAHLCSSVRTYASFAASLATLGRIIPFATFLIPVATQLLDTEHIRLGENESDDAIYLLGLFRLLRFNSRVFRRYVKDRELSLLLGKGSRHVTYLAIRIFQIVLEGSDHWLETTITQYLGEDSAGKIDGPWDDRTIDYRFLTLWEEDREDIVRKQLARTRVIQNQSSPSRTIPWELFHRSTSHFGGVMFSTSISPGSLISSSSLVATETISKNLLSIAQALKTPAPILLSGVAGAGKTILARAAAEALGKLGSMVTLHLNEQSDAKMLLGIYTTGDTPGSFMWKPGVLTTAVQEGRWVLVEDLDKAPNEVLGTLLPLIEKRELFIPNRKDKIYAAEGFRIIATIRTSINHRGEETQALTHMLGARHWSRVPITMPSMSEHAVIARSLFPALEKFLPQFIAAYERLEADRRQSSQQSQSRTGVLRPISPRDLLKWCQRVSLLLTSRSSITSTEMDSIFLEAIDCFAGALPDGTMRSSIASAIAEELRIDPQRRDYLLESREVSYKVDQDKITIGRYSLPRSRATKAISSFSTNPHTTRMLERVTAAVANTEPLLLVGETGVGKTTAVQHLANHLGKKLVPFNLSQQSEAGDLLGGFKPVNARTLMVPLKDRFDDLFAQSFSLSKNKKFVDQLGSQMAKANWRGVCKYWRLALEMVAQQRATSPPREGEAPAKKRKTETSRVIDFAAWDAFEAEITSLQRRLGAGTDAFAFTFVEGNIVKAVRNGDWVLLDEINLASSDTLESIADLLDSDAPSLLLTEAGNIERINAHPEFRVFAAMNPATDVGKKDLPPGVRSRFTELYVESPDKDLKSLQSIVRAYLRQEASADAAVALDVSKLYQAILALADENKLVDGAGQKPHFSLRTLTRTLSYAKHIQQMCNLRRALYEGFQMSFLTFLDAESEALVHPLIIKILFAKRTNVKSELSKALQPPKDNHEYVRCHDSSKHWIRKGASQVQEQVHYIITPFIERNLENLVRAASTRQFPVLIQGPTSAGKTSMIEYLAKRTGHTFTRINNHEHTDLQEYLGTYVSGVDGRLQFQEGVLVKALREGHWIVLDELNLAPTDVLEALNRLLDDNRELLIPETQEVIRPHSDFMLFATQNPAGLYGGRKTLSRAFRNRFLELHFDDIPVNELQIILEKRTQLPPSRCERIVSVYKDLSILRQENRLFEQKSFATLRDLFRWALRPNDTIEQLAINGYMLLCERVRKPEERTALKHVIEEAMSRKSPKVRIDEDELYANDCSEVLQHQHSASDRSVVWTKAMRRLYVLVSRAIANDEPVLLVGETGCGKTTVCQMLSDALKKTLHTVNAHQNTETGDLIGSQRPVRNRAAIETELRKGLLSFLSNESDSMKEHNTDELLRSYDSKVSAMDAEQRSNHLRSTTHVDVVTLRTRFKALFEWVDGSLVEAMRAGELFLLDEISLADDSVLERLNSVLEPSRSILLAEKGALDSSVTAATGFQFFATMNPGGDYGKRELSPALRNRFTEIWVPAMSDMDDVLQIVQSKLATPAQPCASAMIAFASWFKSRFDTSASSSVSIRDTLAWVQFVNAFAQHGPVPAVVHGAAMVYIDTLGANPAGLMSATSQSLASERAACIHELSRLMSVDATSIYGQSLELHMDDSTFRIGPFNLDRAPAATRPRISFTFEPPTTKTNALRVLRALQIPKPVLLEGSPGVGKTALVMAVADAVNMPLTRINLSDQTDLLDLFGSDAPVEGANTGTFVWRDAPFLRAMKKGEWVLLDEMNLASQSVLEGLNACLDHRGEVFVPELGQTFVRHPDFRLFAAQNPHHQGGGRKGLPASFVNRFTVVYADAFAAEDLMLICRRKFSIVDAAYVAKAVEFVSKLNHEVAELRTFGMSGGPWEFNLRDITRWLALAASNIGLLKAGSPKDFVAMLFSQRFRSAFDRDCVDDLFNSTFDGDENLADVFCNLSRSTVQVGLGLLPRNPIKATSVDANIHRQVPAYHLRVLQTVMLCVHQCWPTILTGSPGTGKTTILESLAAAVGADVFTLGMSAETDSLDLIGGYEQYDPHRQIAAALNELRSKLTWRVKVTLANGSVTEANALRDALANVEADPKSAAKHAELIKILPDDARAETAPLLNVLASAEEAIDKARFEWIDGPLIEAMQQGKWMILDNANLCSASVLDRLNGLMEPDGVLIVNEHSAPDGSARVVRPHPAFRIFLTVDPRLGELSRAMRNRAVEIYLPKADDTAAASTAGLHSESAMTRFRAFRDTGSAAADEQAFLIKQDHLGLADQALAPRFYTQVQHGLYAASADTAEQDLSACSVLGSATGLTAETTSQYAESANALEAPADFAYAQVSSLSLPVSITADGKSSLQTSHPLNNQPLVQLSEQSFNKALSLAARYDLGVFSSFVASTVRALGDDHKLLERLTRFWKNARQQLKGRGKTSPIEIAQELTRVVQRATESSWPISTKISHIKKALEGLLAYSWVFARLLASDALDLPLLTASAFVGRSICTKYQQGLAHCGLIAEFQSALANLGVATEPESRNAFVALWKALMPDASTSFEGLQALLNFEDSVEQFDQLTSDFRLPVKHIIDLRLAFQRSLNVSASSVADLNALVESVRQAMPKPAPSIEGVDNAMQQSPHFAESFELLSQRFAVLLSAEPSVLQHEHAVAIEMLAGRKTTDGLKCSRGQPAASFMETLRLLGLNVRNLPEYDVSNGSGVSSVCDVISREILVARDVSLKSLDLLEAESQIMGQTIASKAHLIHRDTSQELAIVLRRLLVELLQAVANAAEGGNLQSHAEHLLRFLRKSEAVSKVNGTTGRSSTANQHTSSICDDLTKASDYNLSSSSSEAAASAWLHFALACLKIYVPEHPFDPVQEAEIHADVHGRTKGYLQSRLNALQNHRQNWYGDAHSLRARLLQKDINELGDMPQVVQVCRPAQSQLTQLQGELQALRRVLAPLLNQAGPLSPQMLDKNGWNNLRVVRARLEGQYRAYADLVSPVVGFVDCLFVARQLSSVNPEAPVNGTLARVTPFLGAEMQHWTSDAAFLEVQQTCRSKDEHLAWLLSLGVRTAVVSPMQPSTSTRTAAESTFNLFYEAWKTQLSRDQKVAAAKSSLYQYRGVDHDSEEATAEQLAELFSSYETNGITAAAIGVQDLAPRMSELYHTLYRGAMPDVDKVIELLSEVARLPSSSHLAKTPTITNMLHKLSSELSSLAPRSSNIYSEPDVGQCRALVTLLKQVQVRFESIHTDWPEHAVPIDVLRTCEQIYTISYGEPLARFFQPVEKLHAAVNEWQKVASSEYSAFGLLEEITNLLISWRQLELSTWAGLFENEDRNAKKSAASWWYIAYETIIRAAASEVDAETSLVAFAHKLIETLVGFLSSCGLGEFSLRLSMLRDFEADMKHRSLEFPNMKPVQQALISLISFYSHFESSVSESLAKKRAVLEKQVKEVIQLASWKDRNILTLSQSAKASHKKLFRLVRKYRNVLSEPVTPLLLGDFPQSPATNSTNNMKNLAPTTAVLDTQLLARHKAWSTQLQSLPAILQQLHAKRQSHESLSKGPAKIEKFLVALDDESSELRKETPNTATEENKTLVQHLKTRKRMLLAQVFRDLRSMGFQANLSDDVLSQQASLSAVLARTLPIASLGQIADGDKADHEFHRVAHIMAAVRESTVKHNEDLTPAEIARSKTLLESMLQTAIEQRVTLSTELAGFTLLNTALRQLSEFSSREELTATGAAHPYQDLKSRTTILLQIVQTCAVCVRRQGELAKFDFSEVTASLSEAARTLMSIVSDLQVRRLPQNIEDQAIRFARARFHEVMASLAEAIVEHSKQHPELEPVLEQLAKWLSADNVTGDALPDQSMSLEQWSEMLFSVVTHVQQIVTAQPGPVSSSKKAWLVENQTQTHDAIHSLSTQEMSSKISQLLSSVARLQNGSSTDLTRAAELSRAVLPVLQVYAHNVQMLLQQACALHAVTCKMAYRLSISFIQLARQGFCQPPDKAEDNEQQSGQVESGTGLGDGDGGEDISKDIGADEDLSELAQDATSKDKNEETQAEKDAVDMADEEDFKGDFDEDAGSEGEEEGQDKEDAEDGDLDEETGHVDADDNAVDEKTWGDGKKAEEAEKEAEKGKGSKNDDMAAADNAEAGAEDEQQNMEDGDETEAADEDEAGVDHQQPEQADPHMQDEQHLDLPEDMQMDGDQKDISDIEDVEDDDMEAGQDAKGAEEEEGARDETKDMDVEMGDEEADDDQETNGEAIADEDQEQAANSEEPEKQEDTAMLDDKPDVPSEPTDALVSADSGQGHEEDSAKQEGVASSVEKQENEQDVEQPSDQSGSAEGSNRTQANETSGQAQSGSDDQQALPFKQLGDILKQHYNQHRPIEAAQEPDSADQPANNEVDMDDPRFEHLPEDADTEMQAIGAANVEDSKALNEDNAIDVNDTPPDTLPLPEDEEQTEPEPDADGDGENSGAVGENAEAGPKRNETVIGKTNDVDVDMAEVAEEDSPDNVEEVDEQLNNTHLSADVHPLMSTEDARRAWTEHENRTRNMAIVLTEHLRLILQPTQATKMRGDFRTGKRLNIKKIIPYIASSYKRDKIWMRRSIPSKRSYQIMLAIDDSQSMNEDERKGLAFDTLALVAKSMSMLEVGEIGIVGFGQDVNVAHDFSMPFTTDAGAEVCRQFTFSQTKTDVRRLLEQSIELFRTARARATGSASDLWQLQLIISDGLCEDHAGIRQLVRQAHNERIMVVFIVVDAAAPSSDAAKTSEKQSILDLNEAKFSIGPNGEPDVQMVRYLDTFPFRYYLIVRDVHELPSVLAGALRQWFSEVVESGG
ncbi:Midasin [Pseudocercospora fuligena]|uniref:Midasin n=1 Tax=Pseudocercospora fuligena TaxID=685502 RepID=A0A8H6RTK0_9PEZI|nr:Midasin [Pseudocercospora fuligena]